jgi:hypothetical protein
VVLVLAVTCLAQADQVDDQKNARAILDRAIQASGGEKLLAAEGSLSGKSSGSIYPNGVKLAVNNEWTVQGLDRLRWSTELNPDKQSASLVIGMNPKKTWIQGNGGKANDVPKAQATPFRQGFLALRLVETLLPLRDRAYTLATTGELKIDGKPALGIKATRKGQPDLDLYFDRATHLPVQARLRLKDGDGSEDVEYVATFADYKKIAGRQHFTKLIVQRDGKPMLDMERRDIKVGDKVDDATFEQP